MKRVFLPLITLVLFFCLRSEAFAQEAKYKAIQGIGYLHTQVTLLVKNWEFHPLAQVPLDDFEEEWREHMLEELEHDEEWAEYMMVEDNVYFHFDDILDTETEDALNANLEFYRQVITSLRDPDQVEKQLPSWREELSNANDRLYEQIYPALCK